MKDMREIIFVFYFIYLLPRCEHGFFLYEVMEILFLCKKYVVEILQIFTFQGPLQQISVCLFIEVRACVCYQFLEP